MTQIQLYHYAARYAVIFHSTRTAHSEQLYQHHSEQMQELVKQVPGFISSFSHRDPITQSGVTVAYFETLESIKAWRENPEHMKVQELGKSHFYSWYEIKVVKVERGYEWSL
jgi:heme-degrading monooxygenase HmoA